METRSGKTLVSTSPQISTEVPTAEATLICETSDTTKEDTGTVSGEESKENEEDERETRVEIRGEREREKY